MLRKIVTLIYGLLGWGLLIHSVVALSISAATEWDTFRSNEFIVLGVYVSVLIIPPFLFLSSLADRYYDAFYSTRRPTRVEAEMLTETYNRLLENAEKNDLSCPRNLRFRVLLDPSEIALAYGYRTVACSPRLLKSSNQKVIDGVVAHEIGHHVAKDIQIALLALAGWAPFIVTATVLRWIVVFLCNFGLIGAVLAFPFSIYLILFGWSQRFFIFLRSFFESASEYEADKYSIQVTGHDGLIQVLTALEEEETRPEGSLLATYTASHPPSALRIDHAFNYLKSGMTAGLEKRSGTVKRAR